MFELRPVAGYEGHYAVSSDGAVWSNKTASRRWLSLIPDRHGYLFVNLSLHGKTRHYLVHRLVAHAWVHNAEPNVFVQVNHINGIKTDNSAANLEWCTGSHNVAHAFRTGLHVHSEAVRRQAQRMGTAARSLTAEEVRSARLRAAAGVSLRSIAESLPLSVAATHNLVHRRTYRDIT
jgi:hypothetical protein